MPPPSLSTTTRRGRRRTGRRRAERRHRKERPGRRPRRRPVAAPGLDSFGRRIAATPRAVDSTPSMPLAPRLANTDTPSRGPAPPLHLSDGHRGGSDTVALPAGNSSSQRPGDGGLRQRRPLRPAQSRWLPGPDVRPGTTGAPRRASRPGELALRPGPLRLDRAARGW